MTKDSVGYKDDFPDFHKGGRTHDAWFYVNINCYCRVDRRRANPSVRS